MQGLERSCTPRTPSRSLPGRQLTETCGSQSALTLRTGVERHRTLQLACLSRILGCRTRARFEHMVEMQTGPSGTIRYLSGGVLFV